MGLATSYPVFSGANYDATYGPFGTDSGYPESGYWIRVPINDVDNLPPMIGIDNQWNTQRPVRVVQSGKCKCWEAKGTDGNGGVAYVHDIREEFTRDELRAGFCGHKILSGLRPANSGLCSSTARGSVQRCRCAWAHNMMYIGTDINAKTGVNCGPWGRRWFYEAPQFDNTGGANPNRGKLYACDNSILPGQSGSRRRNNDLHGSFDFRICY